MGLFNNKKEMTDEEVGHLFNAGMTYLTCKAFSSAYSCFDKIFRKDSALLFNKALCWFEIGQYEKCYEQLREAELSLPREPIDKAEQLPSPFGQWEYEESSPFCPMPQEVPPAIAFTQLMRLKAESAFRLRLYGEVRNISAILGSNYRHVNELVKRIDNDNL